MKKVIIIGAWLSVATFMSSCATLKKNTDNYDSSSVGGSDNRNWDERDSSRDRSAYNDFDDSRFDRDNSSRYRNEDRNSESYRDRRSNESERYSRNDRYYPLSPDDRRSDRNYDDRDDRRDRNSDRYDRYDDQRYGDSRFGNSRNSDSRDYDSRYDDSRNDNSRGNRYEERDDRYDRNENSRGRGFADQRDREESFRNSDRRSNRDYSNEYSRRDDGPDRRSSWNMPRADYRDSSFDKDAIRLEAIVGHELDNLDDRISRFRVIETDGKRRKRKLAKKEIAILEEQRGELFKLYRKVNVVNPGDYALVKSEVDARLEMIRAYVPNPEIYLK